MPLIGKSVCRSLPGDDECQKFWADDTLRAKTVNAPALASIDPSTYDALFFAAGFGVMWDFCGTASNGWSGDPVAMELIRSMYESGKPVGAVCHGPIVFAEVKLTDGSYLVNGKAVAGFTNEEEDAAGNRKEVEQPYGPGTTEDRLKARGARHVSAANWTALVQQDGLLFTGQNPQSASPLAARMAAHMLEAEVSKEGEMAQTTEEPVFVVAPVADKAQPRVASAGKSVLSGLTFGLLGNNKAAKAA